MKIAITGEPPEGDIRITSRGGREGAVTIHGLAPEEIEHIVGAIEHGSFWIRVESEKESGDANHRLVMHPVFAPFPDPIKDTGMLPFWREFDPETVEGQLKLFVTEPLREQSSPSITIQHLCGYNYTPKNYAHEAEKLGRWGFFQMRSPRGSDGKYREQWVLPGLWSAKDELCEAINGAAEEKERALDPYYEREEDSPRPQPPTRPTEKERLERALRFLQRRANFGTLDLSVQKMAMVLD